MLKYQIENTHFFAPVLTLSKLSYLWLEQYLFVGTIERVCMIRWSMLTFCPMPTKSSSAYDTGHTWQAPYVAGPTCASVSLRPLVDWAAGQLVKVAGHFCPCLTSPCNWPAGLARSPGRRRRRRRSARWRPTGDGQLHVSIEAHHRYVSPTLGQFDAEAARERDTPEVYSPAAPARGLHPTQSLRMK